MSTGIYLRVKRDDRFGPVLIENLTEEERAAMLTRYDHAALVRCVSILCKEVEAQAQVFQWLEKNPDLVQRSTENEPDGNNWCIDIGLDRPIWCPSIRDAVEIAIKMIKKP